MADDPKKTTPASSGSGKSAKSNDNLTPAERAAKAAEEAAKAEDKQKRQEAKVVYEKALAANLAAEDAAKAKAKPYETAVETTKKTREKASTTLEKADTAVKDDKEKFDEATKKLNDLNLQLADLQRAQKQAADKVKTAQGDLDAATKAQAEAQTQFIAAGKAEIEAKDAFATFKAPETDDQKKLVLDEVRLAEFTKEADDAEAWAAYEKTVDDIDKAAACRTAQRV